ncbi:hypothetical protein ACIQV3_34065 [Streptomyces sp. NPDC099050]|uniref:hypothetical protein n=1 Tax=Streptomyces sp. NPDC099050 TaxID=3366100 RepID=UPI003807CBF6
MKHGESGDALVLEAREMPAAGQGKEEVFAELAARTGDWDACALALCLTLGVSRPDAEARIHEARPLFDEFAAGEEDIVAMLLACGHVFAVDQVLDGRGERIRNLLWTAACARGGFPGGMIPWFRTEKLTKIFLLFAADPVPGRAGAHFPSSRRPWLRPGNFWRPRTARTRRR